MNRRRRHHHHNIKQPQQENTTAGGQHDCFLVPPPPRPHLLQGVRGLEARRLAVLCVERRQAVVERRDHLELVCAILRRRRRRGVRACIIAGA